MPELTSAIQSEVLAACQTGAVEAAASLSRSLDIALTVAIGDASILAPKQDPEELNGPGLAVVFTSGSQSAVFTLPESTGLLPDWYKTPDKTGQSKLTTLAQELGMLLLPETVAVSDFKASRVENLGEALRRGELADEAVRISIDLSAENGRRGTASLIWPFRNTSLFFGGSGPLSKTDAVPTAAPAPPSPKNAPKTPVKKKSRRFHDYTKSLLRIQVPVVVTLAEKKQQLDRILELGPGMIIHFGKSCDEMLDLEVNNRKIAQGEVVKVGDKFGLRVTGIVMPDESFVPVSKRAMANAR
jgi:flagellar motor switch protein FliN